MGNLLKTSKFTKNDAGFICECCNHEVGPLGYTSRDHCNSCLSSLHVDINPGDRENKCKGLLVPVGIQMNNKKGYIIEYQCASCGELHRNKAASDDDLETIIAVSNHTYNERLAQLKKNVKLKFSEPELNI